MFPLAPLNRPVPPATISVSVPEKGSDGLGWHAPGQITLLSVSSKVIEPPARVMVRRSQPPLKAAAAAEHDRLGGLAVRDELPVPAQAALRHEAAAVDIRHDGLDEGHAH